MEGQKKGFHTLSFGGQMVDINCRLGEYIKPKVDTCKPGLQIQGESKASFDQILEN